jgi:hypothetical protein
MTPMFKQRSESSFDKRQGNLTDSTFRVAIFYAVLKEMTV